MTSPMQVYLDLLRTFTRGDLTADEFETRYLVAFKGDRSFHDEPVYEVLNSLFSDVDAYCADESIRDSNDLGPIELLDSARRSLASLEELQRLGAK